jgi:Flp pilus assembly pilin Flp
VGLPSEKEKKMKKIWSFLKDERGLELPEYAVNTALIVGTLVTAIGALAIAIGLRFDEVTGVIDGIAP